LIGESAAIRGLRDWIRQVGPTTAPILIEGEPGSGRRLVARLLHHQGGAAATPLLEVDALACSSEQLEAVLFPEGDGGTGRMGAVGLAPNGTLVVNEIGACPLNVQAGILRLIQQRPDEGSPESIATAPLRLIATTSRALDRLVARQQFLPELYFRLSVLPVRIPPLRERREEVPALATHFAVEAARQFSRATPVISESCAEALKRHDWPGNVQELRAVIEGAVCRCRGTSISAEHLSPRLRAPEASAVPEMPCSFDGAGQYLTLAELEKRHILATLDHFQGSRTLTASSLDISIRTLRNKLVQYRTNGEKSPCAVANAA
jgi:DNA-binding NtrC family response regulator